MGRFGSILKRFAYIHILNTKHLLRISIGSMVAIWPRKNLHLGNVLLPSWMYILESVFYVFVFVKSCSLSHSLCISIGTFSNTCHFAKAIDQQNSSGQLHSIPHPTSHGPRKVPHSLDAVEWLPAFRAPGKSQKSGSKQRPRWNINV